MAKQDNTLYYLLGGAAALYLLTSNSNAAGAAVGAAKKPTIYDIARLTRETSPYYFEPKTLKFFGQKMSSFKIQEQADGRYKVYAEMRDSYGRNMGQSVRYFNPINNELERE